MNVINTLKDLPAKEKNFTLIFDSMSIRQQVIFDETKGRYVGFENYGGELCFEEGETPAKQVLVFMIVNLKRNWKWPIAYFLVNKLKAEILA